MAHAVYTDGQAVVDANVTTWEPEPIMTPPRDGLIQMIQQNDDKHEEAHRRLRQDLDKLEEQVNKGFQSLRDGFITNQSRIDTVANAPIDVAKLVMTPRIVIGIVMLVLSVAGAMWASTLGLRSDVRDILTRMDAKRADDANLARIQELQIGMLKATVEDMKKRQELKQYDIQDLTNALNGMKDKR
jgi:hypothetical protein